MANKKQRLKNRQTAKTLKSIARFKELENHTCENCGQPGGHWVSTRGLSLAGMLSGIDDQEGFWTCPKYYGEDGRRLPE